MTLTKKLKSPKRTLAAAIVVVALAAGAAFALLQGWGIIMGSTISTDNADLVLSTDGVNFSPVSYAGLKFGHLVPGGYPAPAGGYPIYVKNNGSTDVDLSFTLNDPPSDPEPDDLHSFHFLLADASGNSAPHDFTLDSLIDNKQSLGIDLAPGATREYIVQIQATDDAEPGMTINNVDLAFVGTARDPNDPN